MTDYQFQNMLRKSLAEAAYTYLTGKQGKKGGEIKHLKCQLICHLWLQDTC
jgi:hypothetical protein